MAFTGRTSVIRVIRCPIRRVVGAIAWLSLSACSLIVDADKTKLGPLPVACEVGQVVSCPCLDGSKSTQTCNNLARYEPCACQGHGAGQAGSAAVLAGSGGMAARGGAGGAAGRVGAAGR